MTKIDQFVRDQNWIKNLKAKKTGDEWECHSPFDDEECKKKKTFYINGETGKWTCHRSGESGVNLKQLEFKLGLVSFKQPAKTHLYLPETEVKQYHADLLNNTEAMTYLTTQRCFSKAAIKQFKLGYKNKGNKPTIVIPYFDKHGACVGLKYDFFTQREGMRERYRKEKGSKTQVFNLQRLDLTDSIYVTEGEYDAISLWQYGYTNVCSLPNGAQGINGWVEDIEAGKDFKVCLDNDSAGADGAEKFADRMGRARCSRVYSRLKDFNDYLQCGMSKAEVDKLVADAEPMFKAPVINIGEYLEEAYKVLDDPEAANGYPTPWESVNRIWGGVRLGETTAASGFTGDGKTTLGMAIGSHMIQEHDLPALIVSPEMREQFLLMELAANYFKKKIETYDELNEYLEKYDGKVFIAKVFDQWTHKSKDSLLNHTFDVIEHAIKHNGVKFIILDHLRLFINAMNQQDSERLMIDQFIQRCIHCAVANNVHIWLVVQPKHVDEALLSRCKKCKKPIRKKISRSDLKGSSSIAQDAHNVILIHRYLNKFCNCVLDFEETIVEIEIAKNRQNGLEGTVPLEFNLDSKANYEEVE